jgi:hypothetical protein
MSRSDLTPALRRNLLAIAEDRWANEPGNRIAAAERLKKLGLVTWIFTPYTLGAYGGTSRPALTAEGKRAVEAIRGTSYATKKRSPRPIKWIGLTSPPDYDILTKRPSGTWDIMFSQREGWVIKPPWYWKTLRDADRIVVGHVDREVARLQAEALIRKDERWPL